MDPEHSVLKALPGSGQAGSACCGEIYRFAYCQMGCKEAALDLTQTFFRLLSSRPVRLTGLPGTEFACGALAVLAALVPCGWTCLRRRRREQTVPKR